MRSHLSIALLTAFLPTLASAQADTDPTHEQVDQEFLGLWSSSFGYNRPYVAAQTYTAGLDGTLIKISIDVDPNAGPAIFEIRDVVDGLPGPTLLSTGRLDPQLRNPLPEINAMVDAVLDRPVLQHVGEQYAILLTGADGQSVGQWIASAAYTGGARFLSQDQGASWYYTDFGDGHFRTFVKPDIGPPTVNLVSPYDGATYVLRSSVSASFSCVDDTEVKSCQGTTANNAPIDTSAPGVKQYSVSAADSFGKQAVRTITYTVVATTSTTQPLPTPPAPPSRRPPR